MTDTNGSLHTIDKLIDTVKEFVNKVSDNTKVLSEIDKDVQILADGITTTNNVVTSPPRREDILNGIINSRDSLERFIREETAKTVVSVERFTRTVKIIAAVVAVVVTVVMGASQIVIYLQTNELKKEIKAYEQITSTEKRIKALEDKGEKP